MRFFREFKEFVARGNVVDLAVGVVIGAAFSKIVSALVDGMVMPLLAFVTGDIKVEQWQLLLRRGHAAVPGHAAIPDLVLHYGMFLQAVIDFLLIALVIFLFLRAYNRLREPNGPAPPQPPEDVRLLREIRDLLARDATARSP